MVVFVLKAYKVPKRIGVAILHMYTSITAYTAGCGDGTYLLDVLCGVKTGCPLSSLLFLLSVNPFIDLIKWLSDGPGFSYTRICADDFGSALAQLRNLKAQASGFSLARRVAGLFLKPSKCVLILSCVKLTQEVEQAIRNWLSSNLPEFKDIKIQSSGKYLGWYLSVDATKASFKEPLSKVVQRVQEVTSGNAPAATSILRFNQRVVPVLAYVSQFSPPQRC